MHGLAARDQKRDQPDLQGYVAMRFLCGVTYMPFTAQMLPFSVQLQVMCASGYLRPEFRKMSIRKSLPSRGVASLGASSWMLPCWKGLETRCCIAATSARLTVGRFWSLMHTRFRKLVASHMLSSSPAGLYKYTQRPYSTTTLRPYSNSELQLPI